MVRGSVKRSANRKADLTVPESDLSSFPARLRLVIPVGTSLESFAAKIGVSISGLKKWLAGNAEPGLSYLCAIAKATDASLNWLCGGEVSTPRDCDYEIERCRAIIKRAEEMDIPAFLRREKIDQFKTGVQLIERMREAMVRERELLNRVKAGLAPVEHAQGMIPVVGGLSEATANFAAPIDASALTDIVKTVEEFLSESKRTLPPAKKGELIALIYDMEATGELNGGDRKKPLDRATMQRLLRLVA